MIFWLALLTPVFLRGVFLVFNANTVSMLPGSTDFTLNKKTWIHIVEFSVAVLRNVQVVRSTDASCHLLNFIDIIKVLVRLLFLLLLRILAATVSEM